MVFLMPTFALSSSDLVDEQVSRVSSSSLPQTPQKRAALRVTRQRMGMVILREGAHLRRHFRRVDSAGRGRSSARWPRRGAGDGYAPSLCAIEWHTPRNALANAMPAMQDALAIFSRASGSAAPYVIGTGQVLKDILHGLERQTIGIVGRHHGRIRLQRMGQHVNTGGGRSSRLRRGSSC